MNPLRAPVFVPTFPPFDNGWTLPSGCADPNATAPPSAGGQKAPGPVASGLYPPVATSQGNFGQIRKKPSPGSDGSSKALNGDDSSLIRLDLDDPVGLSEGRGR